MQMVQDVSDPPNDSAEATRLHLAQSLWKDDGSKRQRAVAANHTACIQKKDWLRYMHAGSVKADHLSTCLGNPIWQGAFGY